MELNNSTDFQYFIQDMSTYLFGANYAYGQLLEHEDIPEKFKSAVARIFMKETEEHTTFAAHLTILKKEQLSYLAFRQLKVKIKITSLQKSKKGYESIYCTLDEFMEDYQKKVQDEMYFISEIAVKKLHMLAFGL